MHVFEYYNFGTKYKIQILKKAILESNERVNDKFISNSTRNIAIVGSIGSGAFRVLGAASLISAPLQIIGALVGLSSTLIALFNKTVVAEQPIISVFNKLYKTEQERIHLNIQKDLII